MAEGALRTALLVEVPEAAPAVSDWLERTCGAKPSSGVPPHVTVLFPFVPAALVDIELIDDLRRVFAAFDAFEFQLSAAEPVPLTSSISHRSHPSPSEPSTKAVVDAYPGYKPYEGQFDSIVPHLTVAEGRGSDPRPGGRRDFVAHFRSPPPRARSLLLEELEPDSARWRALEPGSRSARSST